MKNQIPYIRPLRLPVGGEGRNAKLNDEVVKKR
jgi:hypothetical protein